MRHITILGSTGSIGTQALDVLEKQPDLGTVTALAAYGHQPALLEKQARIFHPELVAVYDREAAGQMKLALRDTGIRVEAGMEGLIEAVSLDHCDMVLTAMVGMVGLTPTVAAIKAHKTIALANKETLVCAGKLITSLAEEFKVQILPVDSEHAAIFQCLDGRGPETVRRILLTASGGPFRGWSYEALQTVTPQMALKHPNWSMGAKITTDSASMMNKGLEMIEARWLFGVRPDQIEVLVHPQSIVHSAVEYTDGSVIAQMAVPDMRLPIQEAFSYPERTGMIVPPLDLFEKGTLTFEKPDEKVFRSLSLARDAMKRGGLYPAVLNAANERAVRQFLNGDISFTDIYRQVEEALADYDAHVHSYADVDTYTLEDVLEIGRKYD